MTPCVLVVQIRNCDQWTEGWWGTQLVDRQCPCIPAHSVGLACMSCAEVQGIPTLRCPHICCCLCPCSSPHRAPSSSSSSGHKRGQLSGTRRNWPRMAGETASMLTLWTCQSLRSWCVVPLCPLGCTILSVCWRAFRVGCVGEACLYWLPHIKQPPPKYRDMYGYMYIYAHTHTHTQLGWKSCT